VTDAGAVAGRIHENGMKAGRFRYSCRLLAEPRAPI
jgi:hypothetical protein